MNLSSTREFLERQKIKKNKFLKIMYKKKKLMQFYRKMEYIINNNFLKLFSVS